MVRAKACPGVAAQAARTRRTSRSVRPNPSVADGYSSSARRRAGPGSGRSGVGAVARTSGVRGFGKRNACQAAEVELELSDWTFVAVRGRLMIGRELAQADKPVDAKEAVDTDQQQPGVHLRAAGEPVGEPDGADQDRLILYQRAKR